MVSVNSFIGSSLVFVSLLMGNGAVFAAGDPSAVPELTERRIVLFRPATQEPPSVSARVREELDKNEFQREFYFSRWVQLNDIDHAGAAPGDRVLFEISPGESVELVISQVVIHPGDGGTFWYAGLPDHPASVLNVIFRRPQGTNRKVAFWGAGLQIPGQGRLFQVITADDLPGWAILREIKPGSGTHLDNTGDTSSAAEMEEMKKERQRMMNSDSGKN